MTTSNPREQKDRNREADTARKMAMTDLADQNLKKHIAAIHISNRLTLTQRKASNVLLYNAYESLLTARVHHIRVKDLAEAIGFNTNNLEPLKEALKTLARTVLEWNILDENGAHEEWGATTLLAQAVIKSGYCIYAYSPDLCEKLYRPEIYALLNLSIQRKFSSGYALALYENCLRYRRVGTTGWIPLDNLKRLLGIGETDAYYQDFRKFNDKVIKPAARQVNETSDLLLEVEYQRDRRKINAVRFQVSDNPQMLLFAQRQAALAVSAETEAAEPAPGDTAEQHWRLRDKLVTFGLNARQIRMALASHAPRYLEDNIAVVERDLAAGKVRNLRGLSTGGGATPVVESRGGSRVRRCGRGGRRAGGGATRTLAHSVCGGAATGGAGAFEPGGAGGAGAGLHHPARARRRFRGAAYPRSVS